MHSDNFNFQPNWGRFRGRHHGFGPGFMHVRRGRGGRSRGDLKFEILAILEQSPRHGYEIMLEIESRRGGMRPSPGSIYPALQMLEDGDFIQGAERDGKRVYTIGDKGRQLLSERPAEEAETVEGADLHGVIADAMRQVHGIKEAAKQIAKSRNIEAFRRAVGVLDKARRELYAILADDI